MMERDKILIVGAGFSGAVIARHLAEHDLDVLVLEERAHIAGNCHTQRDADSGVMEHVYGPHIFHTDDPSVWDYLRRFCEFMPYKHQVKTTVTGRVYSLPINLHTINHVYDTALRPDEARAFIQAQADSSISAPQSFEEQALQLMGADLYRLFFKDYTQKQWGRAPQDLPASLLNRLPLRFNYDDNYFFHRFQAMPKDGYTALVGRILDHPNITLRTTTRFERGMEDQYAHVFYSGALDGFFNFKKGRLAYRTLDFERFDYDGDYQGCAVMNYGDAHIPYTRITEHKHFAPWEQHTASLCAREFSREAGPDDPPYYPIRLVRETAQLSHYVALAQNETNVTFVGRLATYRYLDMDVTIREALETAHMFLKRRSEGRTMPAFVNSPL